MKNKLNNETKYALITNRVLLGLLMLVPGLFKLSNPSGIIGMLSGIGFPVASFFGWLVILSEIIFGIAILANYKLRYSTIPPMVILIVAAIVTNLNGISWPNLLMHLTLVANYWVFGAYASSK